MDWVGQVLLFPLKQQDSGKVTEMFVFAMERDRREEFAEQPKLKDTGLLPKNPMNGLYKKVSERSG